MIERIESLRKQVSEDLSSIESLDALEAFRVKYLVRKGMIASLFETIKNLRPEDRPTAGKLLNELRQFAEEGYQTRKRELTTVQGPRAGASLDLTLPGRPRWIGSKHPLTQILEEVLQIFNRMGFDIASGPEIEDDYYNFEALNFPPDHPARDMQDTFFVADQILLRTHTSPVQIRVMEKQQPPVRIICPGRVYRCDSDQTHSPVFHQVEGLYVDDGVTFSELKGTLIAFAHQLFGESLRYRFRPSFFPFTEPSAEMDISCFACEGKGCRLCKNTGWLEIMGCGMVDPNVFKYVNYDAEKFTGYAFGMGIERIAMLRYGIDDIRLFFENDVRMLDQF